MAAYSYNPYSFNNRGNPNNPEQDQVALFIDWDNLVISNYADRGGSRPDLEVLVRRAQQYGTVVIARAYAEWNITADRLEVYKAGIEPIYAPVFHADRDLSGQTSRGKSLADPVMVTDCIDFLHLLPQVGTYVLVTGDKDMVPAVRLARLRGRRVVVIGPDYVANVLQQVSDEFIPYRLLLAQATPVDPYAAYYQQAGYFPPGQLPPQGFFPPQPGQPAAQPQQPPQAPTTDRRGRRISNRRGSSNYPPPAPQPYARIPAPPAPQPMPVPGQPGYNYYGPPQVAPGYAQPQPEGYVQPGAFPAGYVQPGQVPAPTPPPAAAYPTQPQPYTVPNMPINLPVPAAPVITPPPEVVVTAVQPSPATGGANGKNDFNEVKEAIKAIIAQRTASGRGQMRARDLKEELLRKIPNFNERRYGFSKFKALLNAAETAGILQIDQSGHILWVSAPGTPKMQFGSTEAVDAGSLDTLDTEDDSSEGEDETVELADNLAETAAVEAPQALVAAPPAQSRTVETEAAVEAPPPPSVPESAPRPTTEERSAVALPEAPIGAHREKPIRREAVGRSFSGARPPLLEQPFYEDVINLIDSLRSRNRWLGYELLLSNVRDYLSHQMPESEAKIQAGTILSKLLNDGIIKMAVEVHSRGARKMTVKVAHLQDENPAVRYTLDNRKAQQLVEAQLAEVAAAQATEAETAAPEAFVEISPENVPALAQPLEAPTEPAQEEAPEAGLWGTHFNRQAHPKEQVDETVEEAPAQTAAPTTPDDGFPAPVFGLWGTHFNRQARPKTEPTAQAEPTLTHSPEISGEAVQAEVVEAPGVSGPTGQLVQGEPEQTTTEADPAPAGGIMDTVEMEAGPHTGNGHQIEVEGKQSPAETLTPVAGIEAEEVEEIEEEPEEVEVVAKAPVRRPRRRRTTPTRPAGEEDGESHTMRQPIERPRLNHEHRPHRRPRN